MCNNSTAGESSPSNPRGGRATTSSAARPSGSRLVHNTTTSTSAASIASTAETTPSSTCSQLSNTSRTRRPASERVEHAPSTEPPSSTLTPTASAMTGTTSAPGFSTLRSAHPAPSGNFELVAATNATATRVLPTPAGPVSVTRRPAASSAVISPTTAPRPISDAAAGSSGRRCRHGGRSGNADDSIVGLCARTAASNACNAGDGSNPSCSDSTWRSRR